MDGGLIFPHHPGRLSTSGRWPGGGRPASRGRLRKERGHIRSRSPRTDSREKPAWDEPDDRTKHPSWPNRSPTSCGRRSKVRRGFTRSGDATWSPRRTKISQDPSAPNREDQVARNLRRGRRPRERQGHFRGEGNSAVQQATGPLGKPGGADAGSSTREERRSKSRSHRHGWADPGEEKAQEGLDRWS
jgi:hypothetical protein